MRIDVQDLRRCGDQTRAYAEYRVFSTLKNFGDAVRHASVTLGPDESDDGGSGGIVCRATITMANGQHIEAVADGRHAYAAIDRVASRIQSLINPRPSAVT